MCFPVRSVNKDEHLDILVGWHISNFSSLQLRHWNKRNLTGIKFSDKLWFSGRSINKNGRPDLWLADVSTSLLYDCRMDFNETWQESSTQSPIVSLARLPWATKFFYRSVNTDGYPGFWLLVTLSDFSSTTSTWISIKIGRKQIPNIFQGVCVFSGYNSYFSCANVAYEFL